MGAGPHNREYLIDINAVRQNHVLAEAATSITDDESNPIVMNPVELIFFNFKLKWNSYRSSKTSWLRLSRRLLDAPTVKTCWVAAVHTR